MGFLLDTNVISELRKKARCARPVLDWYEATPVDELYTSVLVLGELRHGIELLRTRDLATAMILDSWLHEIEIVYDERILSVTSEICNVWGRLSIRSPLPPIDGLLAATAIVHDLTLVTRNIADVKESGARCLDPFVAQT